MILTNTEQIETAARGMYGPGWDGPREKQPGEKMKDVWRAIAQRALKAVENMQITETTPCSTTPEKT